MSADLPNGFPVDYHFGPYRFDGRLRRLYKDGEPLTLTPKAADTLVALLERAGRVVEKDELLRVVWGDTFVGEDTLAQNISTLRRVLADHPSRPQFIATIPRRGYRFVAPVREAGHLITGGAQGTRVNSRPAASQVAWIMNAAAVVAAALVWFVVDRGAVDEPRRTAVQFTISEPDGHRFSTAGGMLAISPDGKHLTVVVTDADGSDSLWLRPLGSNGLRPLAGTDGAENPLWSPDSRTIAFFAQRRLKAVDVESGAVRVIASLLGPRSIGGTWSRHGQILFSVPDDGMYLVAASGGSPQKVSPTGDAACEGCRAWPFFLPDGRRFLYTVINSTASGIYMGEIGKPGGRP